jgi:hypothetical protein
MTNDHRVVLAPDVARVEFEDFAILSDWRLHLVTEAGDDNPYEEIWTVGDGTSAVHYVEDGLLGASYVLTMGEDATSLAAEVGERLRTLTTDEAIAWAYVVEDPNERVRAIGYLAAAAPSEPTEMFVGALAKLLRDEYAEVRNAALFACARLCWPRLDPLLQEVRNQDPDQSVRENAGRTLDAIRRYRDGAPSD